MPSLQDIEAFKKHLHELGNEREILQERGEAMVDVPPPESGLSDDLSALLDGTLDNEDSTTEDPGDSIDTLPDDMVDDVEGIDESDFLNPETDESDFAGIAPVSEDEPSSDSGFSLDDIGLDEPVSEFSETTVPDEPSMDGSSDISLDDLLAEVTG